MNSVVTPREVERFRSAILRAMGLQFDDTKLGLLDEVLRRRLAKMRAFGEVYLSELERHPSQQECAALAEELTVTETYFFRNHDQFDALAGTVLPDRMRRHGTPRPLRLLSAGCASGEEAYTLAIVTSETIPDRAWMPAVRAIDLNPVALAKARHGHYSEWALRETPADARARWFTSDGRDMVVNDAVRALVTFEQVNLADPHAEPWRPNSYDVIFCRNVLMYFSPEQRRAAIARMTHALMPGGYLFLGHAESMSGLSDAFHLRHTHETFYYQRKDAAELAAAPIKALVAPEPRRAQPTLFDAAWADTIRAASERVAALLPDDRTLPPQQRGNDLAPALDLLHRERFAEALDYIGGQPDAEDPSTLLLSAVLLQQSGRGTEADDACRRLLALDELSAGAHYVLALSRENGGDLAASAEHDRTAAYLDPTFAMPRLHLGLLARRGGDRDQARRELSQALLLLEHEGASRLLLFGGGFNREALVTLCRSTLIECGGRP